MSPSTKGPIAITLQITSAKIPPFSVLNVNSSTDLTPVSPISKGRKIGLWVVAPEFIIVPRVPVVFDVTVRDTRPETPFWFVYLTWPHSEEPVIGIV